MARALDGVGETWLRQRFETLEGEQWNYTWVNFVGIKAFYGRAADAGRGVPFTAT